MLISKSMHRSGTENGECEIMVVIGWNKERCKTLKQSHNLPGPH